ncbi:unnamed protein product, partial [Brenthis ino]
MNWKMFLLCTLCVIENANAFVKRNVESSTSNSILDSFQRNMDRFRDCMDKTLAAAVSEVNEKQLQPIFSALGDQLNKFSKVVDILTAPTTVTTT